jgi:hypothetical protein
MLQASVIINTEAVYFNKIDIIPKFRTCSKIIEPFEKSTEMR